ncbi:MAG: MFS transporter, partial [Frankiaceae bacterium]
GSAAVFGANAASYLAVLAALLAMQQDELRPARRLLRGRGQLRAGLRYVVSRRELLLPIVLVGFVGALGLNFSVTLALAARSEFGGSAATYGALVATVAFGSLIGAVLAARRAAPTMRLLVGAAFAFGVLEATAGLMPTLASFAVLLVPTGAAVLTFTTAANASVQLAAGEQMRGRVMALYILVFLGTTPLGAPLIGWISGSFGPRVGLVVGGLGSAAAAAVIAWLLRRPLVQRQPQTSTQLPEAADSAAASSARQATRRSRAVAASGGASGVPTRCTAPRTALARASKPSGAPEGCAATGTCRTPRSS